MSWSRIRRAKICQTLVVYSNNVYSPRNYLQCEFWMHYIYNFLVKFVIELLHARTINRLQWNIQRRLQNPIQFKHAPKIRIIFSIAFLIAWWKNLKLRCWTSTFTIKTIFTFETDTCVYLINGFFHYHDI